VSFDPLSIRLGINGTLITADCVLPGCHWNMRFTPMMRLGQVLEVCEQHPCKPEPCSNCGHREGS
jgi:hypothetical protein